MSDGLRGVATQELARLLREIRAGLLAAPLSKPGLSAVRLGHLWQPLALQRGLDRVGLLAVLEAVLAEREGGGRALVELVWSGPAGASGWSRPTGAVVRELFEGARRSVLLAGYSFDHGKEILAPLHRVMQEHGVAVEMYVDVKAAKKKGDVEAHRREELLTFLSRNWPFGPPNPVLHYDPRTARYGSVESLHAKCIVVDERMALIGSANFTDRGQSRNIEVGGLIEDESFARALVSQWRAATAAGVFVRWDG